MGEACEDVLYTQMKLFSIQSRDYLLLSTIYIVHLFLNVHVVVSIAYYHYVLTFISEKTGHF